MQALTSINFTQTRYSQYPNSYKLIIQGIHEFRYDALLIFTETDFFINPLCFFWITIQGIS